MVDAEDLKSFGHCDRVGSSPTIPTTLLYTSLYDTPGFRRTAIFLQDE